MDATPILIVEGEAPLRRGLEDCLRHQGYAPTGCGDGASGLATATNGDFALVVLDVMLPGMDGFAVCRHLRLAKPDQPILLLTAKGSEADILQGFEAGADDYVTKPFSLAQLLARIKALVRRAQQAATTTGHGPFLIGSATVDPDDLTIRVSDATAVALNRRDVGILALLGAEPGRIVSRRLLLQTVWGYRHADAVETRSVDMQIVKLRRKLKQLGSPAPTIETVRGEGYRLARNGAP